MNIKRIKKTKSEFYLDSVCDLLKEIMDLRVYPEKSTEDLEVMSRESTEKLRSLGMSENDINDLKDGVSKRINSFKNPKN